MPSGDSDPQLYERLMAASGQGLIVYDQDLRYRFWNPFMEQLTGHVAGEVLGRRNVEVFPFLRETGLERSLRRALAGETVDVGDVFLRMPKTGRQFWQSARYIPERDRSGRVVGVAAVVSDVSERRRVQEALQRAEAQLQELQRALIPGTSPGSRSNHEAELPQIVGHSAALQETLRQVAIVAPTRSSVLLSGETGTGKELLAHAIHAASPRRQRALVAVNCGALSPQLVESELFGHVKGAFSGAIERRLGRFELADQGTIFLDEVAELSHSAQAALLRVLQSGELSPVGSSRLRRVDVRIIAATHQDLGEAVRQGRFRSDLFYRLAVFPILVPPLRERLEDLPLLVEAIAARYARELGKPLRPLSRRALAQLAAYDWPGNVRELQNVLQRAIAFAPGDATELDLEAFDLRFSTAQSSLALASSGTLSSVQRAHIAKVLRQTGGVIEGPAGAAAILGLRASTLRSRMQRLELKR